MKIQYFPSHNFGVWKKPQTLIFSTFVKIIILILLEPWSYLSRYYYYCYYGISHLLPIRLHLKGPGYIMNGDFVLRVCKPNRKNLQQNFFSVFGGALMGHKKPTHGTFQQAKRPHLALVSFVLLPWYLVDTQRVSWGKKGKKLLILCHIMPLVVGITRGWAHLGSTSPHLASALIPIVVMASASSTTRPIILGVEILGKFPLQNFGLWILFFVFVKVLKILKITEF